MKMKKDNTSIGIKVFAILIIIGVIGGIVDGVAYQLHVRSHGVSLFGVVPMSILWSYTKTFPGNVLTAFWLVPWAIAFAMLQFKGRRNRQNN